MAELLFKTDDFALYVFFLKGLCDWLQEVYLEQRRVKRRVKNELEVLGLPAFFVSLHTNWCVTIEVER